MDFTLDTIVLNNGTRTAALENLVLIGGAVTGTGNLFGNSITGNGQNNVLSGLDGNDSIDGGAGGDTLSGGNGNDTLTGGEGDGVGDILVGGAGDDVYFVGTGDFVSDSSGVNVAFASSNYSVLGSGLSEITLTGTADIDAKSNQDAHRIIGNSGANKLTAVWRDGKSTGVDTLIGGLGNDTLIGSGRDRLEGGAGDDTYFVIAEGDSFLENVGEGTDLVYTSTANVTLAATDIENLQIASADGLSGTGNGLGNRIFVTSGRTGLGNLLTGLGGNDTLDGGFGADTMDGGQGNDLFFVDNTADVLVEAAGEGTDVVNASATYTLSANIETLVLTGTAAINGTGNEVDNLITGTDAANVLDGGAGADTLRGGKGNDRYVVDNVADVVFEVPDFSTGTELITEGNDTIDASVSYTLSNSVEVLTLTGTADIDATGNNKDNILTGNDGNNVLRGELGADSLVGGRGNDTLFAGNDLAMDTLVGGAGNDTYHVTMSTQFVTWSPLDPVDVDFFETGRWLYSFDSRTMYTETDVIIDSAGISDTVVLYGGNIALYAMGNMENAEIGDNNATRVRGNSVANRMIGGAGSNDFYGLGGDDTLDGGASGGDYLNGGTGNDTYIVRHSGVTIVEVDTLGVAEGDADRVIAFTTHALGANIESMVLNGAAAITGTGNDLANLITVDAGSAANHVLLGAGGNDTLIGNAGDNRLDGGAGADTMTGGRGNDTYVFDNAGDVIIETAAGGIDTVEVGSGVVYTLATTIENVSIVGSGASAQGTAGNNLMRIVSGTGNALYGNEGNDSLVGSAAAETLDGGTGADTLVGNSGLDTFVVDNAGDVVIGGGTLYTSLGTSGTNIFSATSNTVTVTSNWGEVRLTGDGPLRFAEVDAGNTRFVTIYGNDLSNILTAGSGGASLFGGGGNDSLVGSATIDTLQGGTGNDLYHVNQVEDAVVENAGEGNDTIVASVDWSLEAFDNIENLVLAGNAQYGTGNALNNRIVGNQWNNTLDGGANRDRDILIGGRGDDIYIVEARFDQVDEVTDRQSNSGVDLLNGAGGWDTVRVSGIGNNGTYILDLGVEVLQLVNPGVNLSLIGNGLGNVLGGTAGADTIRGGAGADTMSGGNGNDMYYVDRSDDVVDELFATGYDKVFANASFSLDSVWGDGVEELILEQDAVNGTGGFLNNLILGNSRDNVLDGRRGADTLVGSGGADTFVVDNIGDMVVELADAAIDTVQSSVFVWSLGTGGPDSLFGAENLLFTTSGFGGNIGSGNGRNNVITGNVGNDTLQGLGGNDTLIGGAGDDTYTVEDAGDVVVELVDQGVDRVTSGVSYTLGANIEVLTLTGNGALTGTGNDLANLITVVVGSTANHALLGAGGNDTLIGNAGDNRLDGGAGADTMSGGRGNDTYVFDNAGDVIIETAAGGIDTVEVGSGVVYTLATTIENVSIVGSGSSAQGTAANNVMRIASGTGNALYGNEGNDSLVGSAAAETLDGGTGADTLVGNSGLDTFVVDNAGDVVIGGGTLYTSLGTSGTNIFSATSNTVTVTSNWGEVRLTGIRGLNALVGAGNTQFVTIYGNEVSNTLTAGSGGANLFGGGGHDSLVGGAATDSLQGGAGNDTLDGGQGADVMVGGVGNDLYFFDHASDAVFENAGEGNDTIVASLDWALNALDNVENLVLAGDAQSATGNALNNRIVGNQWNNVLEGGLGRDTLIGGLGDDTYVIDARFDTIDELTDPLNAGGVDTVNGAGGRDTARVSGIANNGSYSLAAGVEVLELVDAGINLSISGNELGNVLGGSAGADTILGGAGTDTMLGGNGNDVYYVDRSDDVVSEQLSSGYDKVFANASYSLDSPEGGRVEELILQQDAVNGTGGSANNVIEGNSRDNILDGRTGADTLTGGGGADTFVVDNAGDVVVEVLDAAIDTVQSALNVWSLGTSMVENLTFTTSGVRPGSTGNAGTGNALNNVITGNVGKDTLQGLEGNDTLIGGRGDDTYTVEDAGDVVIEAASSGLDRVNAGVSFTLGANVEVLTLTGSGDLSGTGNGGANTLNGNDGANLLQGLAGADTLNGGQGNDTLDGGSEADIMSGGLGDDTYVVNGAADLVNEVAAEGADWVLASLSYTLGANLENLTLTGSLAINGTGNDVGNALTGNTGANLLSGGAGDDELSGGAGNDTLDGGTGADTMVGDSGLDTFVVDNVGDVVFGSGTLYTEFGTSGSNFFSAASDTVTLTSNWQEVRLTGTRGLNAVVDAGNTQRVSIYGNDADNTLVGGSGGANLFGGEGNDTLVFAASNAMDGGAGIDTLIVNVSTANLSAIAAGQLAGLEVVSLLGNGANTLILDKTNVLAFSDTSDTVTVWGEAGDAVVASGGWTENGTVQIDGVNFIEYVSGTATLQVRESIDRSGIEGVSTGEFNLADLNGTNGFRLLGGEAGDLAGVSASTAGDLNGDGYDDLIVGASGKGGGYGAAYVVFGKASGFAASQNLDMLTGSDGFRIDGIAEGNLGGSVGGGADINADGFDDILIGASNYGGTPPVGGAFVVYGAGGIASADLSALDGNNGFRIENNVAGRQGLGVSVAVIGDMDGDGFSDYVIGHDDALGSAALLGYYLSTTPVGGGGGYGGYYGTPSVFYASDMYLSVEYASGTTRFGWSVAGAGDFNGDGLADAIVGAPDYDGTLGAAFIMLSLEGESGFGYSTYEADGTRLIRLDGVYGDHAGVSVSGAGDFNGDGFGDVIIGTSNGKAYLVYGASAGFTPSIDLSTLDGSNGFMIEGGSGTEFKVAGVGDTNADGYDDILIGDPEADANGTDSGAAYLVFGNASVSGNLSLSAINGSSGIVIKGVTAGELAGGAVAAAGDVNNDGYADFTIGSPGHSGNGADAGAVYVVFGQDFNGAAGAVGTAGNDTLTGGAGAVMFGVGGDDRLELTSANPFKVDGGTGVDTLALDAAGASVDLSGMVWIKGIERIDLGGAYANALSLSAADVLRLSDTSNTLTLMGDATDSVAISGSWLDAGTVSLEGQGYRRYVQGQAQLLVDSDMGRTITVAGVHLPLMSGDRGFAVVGNYEAVEFMSSVVSGTGDLNGDGFDDFLVTGTSYDYATSTREYLNYVVFGSAAVPAGNIPIASLDASNSIRIISDVPLLSVRPVGDVNGDGYEDMIVGDESFSATVTPSGRSSEGAAYLVFGSSTPASSIDLAALNGSNGFRILGDPGDGIGRIIESGDFNGDGLTDLVLARPAVEGGREIDVIYGTAGGFGSTLVLSSLALDGTDGFRVIHPTDTAPFLNMSTMTVEPQPNFIPTAVTVGDIDNDGKDDLVIGSPSFLVDGTGVTRGATFVVYGTAGASGTVDLASTDASVGLRIYGPDQSSGRTRFAERVDFIGDFNGDGYGDFAVSASGEGFTVAGETYVVFGGARGSGIDTVYTLGSDPLSVAQPVGGSLRVKRVSGENGGDRAGWGLSAAGDVNGDGLDDLLVGARTADSDVGRAYLIYGQTGAGALTDIDLGTLDPAYGQVLVGDASTFGLGIVLAPAGDINGDGVEDFLVGQFGPDTTGGASFVVYGSSPLLDSVRDNVRTGSSASDADEHNSGTFYGTSGNDSMVGFTTIFNGGDGDDLIKSTSSGVLAIRGGAGNDTFHMLEDSGGNNALNFVDESSGSHVPAGKITGVEEFYFVSGIQSIALDAVDVARISDTDSLRISGLGTVTLDDSFGTWNTAAGTGLQVGYTVATSGAATVLVQYGMTLAFS